MAATIHSLQNRDFLNLQNRTESIAVSTVLATVSAVAAAVFPAFLTLGIIFASIFGAFTIYKIINPTAQEITCLYHATDIVCRFDFLSFFFRSFFTKDSPLHLALKEGNTELAKAMIEKGFYLDRKDKDGFSSFYLAVKNGYLEVAKLLIEKGCLIEFGAIQEYAPELLLEIINEMSEEELVEKITIIVPFLINSLAKLSSHQVDKFLEKFIEKFTKIRDFKKIYFIHKAFVDFYSDVVCDDRDLGSTAMAKKMALLSDMQIVMRAFAMAITELLKSELNSDQLDFIAKFWLPQKGREATDLDCFSVSSMCPSSFLSIFIRGSRTAIHHFHPLGQAAAGGYMGVVQYLVERENTDVDIVKSYYLTPLMLAAKHGHLQVVKYLVQQGADVKRHHDSSSTSALFEAVGRDADIETVRFLIDNGAEVNPLNPEGNGPLHRAARESSLEVVQCLVENGAAVNGIREAFTPLCSAVNNSEIDSVRVEIVQYLVEHGANVNSYSYIETRDGEKISCFLLAVKNTQVGIGKILLENGAIFQVNETSYSNSQFIFALIMILSNQYITNSIEKILDNIADHNLFYSDGFMKAFVSRLTSIKDLETLELAYGYFKQEVTRHLHYRQFLDSHIVTIDREIKLLKEQ